MFKNTAQLILRLEHILYTCKSCRHRWCLVNCKQKNAAFSISNNIFVCIKTYTAFRPASSSLLARGISRKYPSCGINKCRSIKQHLDDSKAFFFFLLMQTLMPFQTNTRINQLNKEILVMKKHLQRYVAYVTFKGSRD